MIGVICQIVFRNRGRFEPGELYLVKILCRTKPQVEHKSRIEFNDDTVLFKL